MFDKLKQPLLGLTLAIAVGCVLAHFAVRFIDNLPSNFQGDPDTYIAVTFWAVVVAGAIFIYTKRRQLLDWIRQHRRKSAWIVISGFLLCAGNGGRVVAIETASGMNRSAAQARGAIVGIFDFLICLWLAGIIFAAVKLLAAKRPHGAQTQT